MNSRRIRRSLFVCITALAFAIPGVAKAVVVPNPVPYVNPLVPSAVAPGGSNYTLTVMGTGFVSGSVVKWNGAALATTFVNNSKLTAVVSSSSLASPVTATITVVSPAPGGGTSNA
jgi:hypothetical protein